MKRKMLLLLSLSCLLCFCFLAVSCSCEKEVDLSYSQGLEYSLNSDGTLTVSGIGTCTDLTVIIPSEHEGKRVTAIGDYAFWRATVVEVIIPNSIVSIGEGAFCECASLRSIVVPNSVTKIGDYAFAYCSSLEISCEAKKAPTTWSLDWNYTKCPTEWSYNQE